METSIHNYAMSVLVKAGKNQYYYGTAKVDDIMDDLKSAYPKGMEFPYIDVANAILSISRPMPITSEPEKLNALATYAMSILAETGCDCHSYGTYFADKILEDLKSGYPDGMEFPYEDVANEILAMSRPEPVVRKPWQMAWSTDSCCDAPHHISFPLSAARRCLLLSSTSRIRRMFEGRDGVFL